MKQYARLTVKVPCDVTDSVVTPKEINVTTELLEKHNIKFVHEYYFPGDNLYNFILVENKEQADLVSELGKIDMLTSDYMTHCGKTVEEVFKIKYPELYDIERQLL